MRIITTAIAGVLLVAGMLSLPLSHSGQVALAQELPPAKDYVCDLFGCGGGSQTCMYITYLLEGDEMDHLITYHCREG